MPNSTKNVISRREGNNIYRKKIALWNIWGEIWNQFFSISGS